MVSHGPQVHNYGNPVPPHLASGSAMMKCSGVMAILTLFVAILALLQELWIRAAILGLLLGERDGDGEAVKLEILPVF